MKNANVEYPYSLKQLFKQIEIYLLILVQVYLLLMVKFVV